MSSQTVAAWEALFRAQVRMHRILNAEFPDGELSFNEYDVLFTISREPERSIPMRELTRNVLQSQSSVSRMVDRLVARGFVSKTDDPSDQRATRVALTEVGFEVFRKVARVHVASIRRYLDEALNQTELEQLRELCERIQSAVPDVGPGSARRSEPNRDD